MIISSANHLTQIIAIHLICVGSTQTFFKGKNLLRYTMGPFYCRYTCMPHDSIIMKREIKIKFVSVTTVDSVTKIYYTRPFPNSARKRAYLKSAFT